MYIISKPNDYYTNAGITLSQSEWTPYKQALFS